VNVLGIDTSTAASAACVLRSDGEAFEIVPAVEELDAPPAHSRDLLPRVAEALERAGLDYADLDAVAVGVGPGAFTGLRVGIATARALAKAHALELRPVSSLEALADGIGELAPGDARLPLVDARRGELFAALYAADGRELLAPFVATPEQVIARARNAAGTALAAGDGSLRFRALLEAAGVRLAPGESPVHVVRALHVCRLAAGTDPVAPEAVLPIYIRAPDARPASP
jgi:tRNA threonylcarbamoyladenosine biosynthesis protein TsaB